MTEEEKAAAAEAAMAKRIKEAVGDVLKEVLPATVEKLVAPISDSIKALEGNQKVLADTLKNLPPASTQAKKDGEGEGDKTKTDQPKSLSVDEVTKLVADAIAADRKAQQTSAEQTAKRDAFINSDASGLAKLAKNPIGQRYIQLGDDPNKWSDEAKSIAQQWEKDVAASGVKIPDVGGASREGGATTAQDAAAAGASKGFLKMPGSAAAPAPAAPAAQ